MSSTDISRLHCDRWVQNCNKFKDEIDRLREVERAARVYVREFDHLIGDDYPERLDLRTALGLKPGAR